MVSLYFVYERFHPPLMTSRMTPGGEAHGGGDGENDRDGRRGRGQADLLRGVRRHDDPHLLNYPGR